VLTPDISPALPGHRPAFIGGFCVSGVRSPNRRESPDVRSACSRFALTRLRRCPRYPPTAKRGGTCATLRVDEGRPKQTVRKLRERGRGLGNRGELSRPLIDQSQKSRRKLNSVREFSHARQELCNVPIRPSDVADREMAVWPWACLRPCPDPKPRDRRASRARGSLRRTLLARRR
jgi:hypothetical protein